MQQITVKLVLVPQSEICEGPYKPGHKDCPVTARKIDSLKHKNRVSRVYQLPAGKSVALLLERDFHQALIADIDAGNYSVLLEFDWGNTLWVVVDMVRASSSGKLPEWSSSHPQFDRGQYWYTHQNAIDFDPDKNVEWQVTLNGNLSFWFYVVPAA